MLNKFQKYSKITNMIRELIESCIEELKITKKKYINNDAIINKYNFNFIDTIFKNYLFEDFFYGNRNSNINNRISIDNILNMNESDLFSPDEKFILINFIIFNGERIINIIKNEFENQSNVVKDVNNSINNDSVYGQDLNVVGIKNKLNVRESDNTKNNIPKNQSQSIKKDKNNKDIIIDRIKNKRNDMKPLQTIINNINTHNNNLSNITNTSMTLDSSSKTTTTSKNSQHDKAKAFIHKFNDNLSDASSNDVGDDEYIDVSSLSSRSRRKYMENLKQKYLELMKNSNISKLNTSTLNSNNEKPTDKEIETGNSSENQLKKENISNSEILEENSDKINKENKDKIIDIDSSVESTPNDSYSIKTNNETVNNKISSFDNNDRSSIDISSNNRSNIDISSKNNRSNIDISSNNRSSVDISSNIENNKDSNSNINGANINNTPIDNNVNDDNNNDNINNNVNNNNLDSNIDNNDNSNNNNYEDIPTISIADDKNNITDKIIDNNIKTKTLCYVDKPRTKDEVKIISKKNKIGRCIGFREDEITVELIDDDSPEKLKNFFNHIDKQDKKVEEPFEFKIINGIGYKIPIEKPELYFPHGTNHVLNKDEYQNYKEYIINNVVEKKQDSLKKDESSNHSTSSLVSSTAAPHSNLYSFKDNQKSMSSSYYNFDDEFLNEKTKVANTIFQMGKNITSFNENEELKKIKKESASSENYHIIENMLENEKEKVSTKGKLYVNSQRPSLSLTPTVKEKKYINRCKSASIIREKWDNIIKDFSKRPMSSMSVRNRPNTATTRESAKMKAFTRKNTSSQSNINLSTSSISINSTENPRLLRRCQSAHPVLNSGTEKSNANNLQNTLILTPVKLNDHGQLNSYLNSRIESIKYSNSLRRKNSRSLSNTNLNVSITKSDSKNNIKGNNENNIFKKVYISECSIK